MTPARTARLLLLGGVAILAACSSGRRIDGSSAATFERSVAMLQNDLPPRKREDFEIALAFTWVRAAALDAGDVDGDGDTDYFRRLDGLGYDEVVELADLPGDEGYVAQLKRQRSQAACAQQGRAATPVPGAVAVPASRIRTCD
jgi:hypothetical protein